MNYLTANESITGFAGQLENFPLKFHLRKTQNILFSDKRPWKPFKI